MMRRAPLIAVGLAVVIAVAFYYLLYTPRVEEQRALEEETLTLEQQVVQLDAQIARLREIERNQPLIAAQIERLERLIPSSPSQPFRELQVAADLSNVEIQQVAFAEPEGAVEPPALTADGQRELAAIALSITIEGGYFQIADFFRRLEVARDTNPRAVLVDSVIISEADEGFPRLAVSTNANIFTLLPLGAAEGEGLGTQPLPSAAPSASPAPSATPSVAPSATPGAGAPAPSPSPQGTS